MPFPKQQHPPPRQLAWNNLTNDSSVDKDYNIAKTTNKATLQKNKHPGQPTVISSLTSINSNTSSESNSVNNSTVINQSTSSGTINHKHVNSKSTNRQQYKWASDDLSRSTPDQNNLSQWKHAFSTRLTFKISCGASENAETMPLGIFEEFIEELIRADASSAILPWKSIHWSKGSILKASDAPKNT